MLELVLLINGLLPYTVIYYLLKYGKEEKIDTIREITKSFKSGSFQEYLTSIPEEEEEEELEVDDEIVEMDSVDAKALIKQLKTEYADNKS